MSRIIAFLFFHIWKRQLAKYCFAMSQTENGEWSFIRPDDAFDERTLGVERRPQPGRLGETSARFKKLIACNAWTTPPSSSSSDWPPDPSTANAHASNRQVLKLIHSKPAALRVVYYKRVFSERCPPDEACAPTASPSSLWVSGGRGGGVHGQCLCLCSIHLIQC